MTLRRAQPVAMEVAHQGKSIAIPADEDGLEAALEEGGCPFTPRTDIARIVQREILACLRSRDCSPAWSARCR